MYMYFQVSLWIYKLDKFVHCQNNSKYMQIKRLWAPLTLEFRDIGNEYAWPGMILRRKWIMIIISNSQLYFSKQFNQHHSLPSLDLHTEHIKLYSRWKLPLPLNNSLKTIEFLMFLKELFFEIQLYKIISKFLNHSQKPATCCRMLKVSLCVLF